MKRLALLLCLICATSMAQNPAVGPIVQVPTSPLAAGVLSDQISVTGLTPEQLPIAQLRCYPSDGVLCRGARGWDGAMFVLFQAKNPGKYTLILVVLSDTPKGDVFIETPVIVGGVVPPEPVNPPQPPVVQGKRLAVILMEKSQTTSQLSKLRLDVRTDANFQTFLKEKGHPQPLFLDKDLVEEPLVKKLMEKSPPLPQLFILDSDGSVVVSQEKVPNTITDLEAAIRKVGG